MLRAGLVIGLILLMTMDVSSAGSGSKEPPVESTYLHLFFKSSDVMGNPVIQNVQGLKDYETLLRYFGKKQAKLGNSEVLAKLVFNMVSDAFLHSYDQYAAFSELFTDYKFDCVTGTALLISFFSDLGMEFEIWETNYHTYIKMVSYDGQKIILEATDPSNGFITGKDVITLEEKYLKDNLEGPLFENGQNIHKTVSPEEFTGLLYYNQAVKSFNKGEYLNSLGFIRQAEIYYPSERINFLKQIILDNVMLGATSSR
jgi:hypothetical protein